MVALLPARIGRPFALLGIAALAALALARAEFLPAADSPASSAPAIDFNQQIRPILSENCYACHGPDAKQRKAKLRLDTREGAFAELRSGGFAIVPGKSAESKLVQRITASDPAEHMPPPKSGKHLTSEQIALLRQWIDQGAPWARHWAFVPPPRHARLDRPAADAGRG